MKFCMQEYLAPIRTYLDPSRIDREAIKAQAAVLRAHAAELTARADELVHDLADKTRGFSLLDFAVFKVCLLSLGIWLGAQFSKFFKKFRVVVFLGFIASYIYLIWRLFLRSDD